MFDSEGKGRSGKAFEGLNCQRNREVLLAECDQIGETASLATILR